MSRKVSTFLADAGRPDGGIPDRLRGFERLSAAGREKLPDAHGNIWFNGTAAAFKQHGAVVNLRPSYCLVLLWAAAVP